MKKIVKTIVHKRYSILVLISLFLSYGLYLLVEWTSRNFADLTMDQVIFHILVPLEGADTSFMTSVFKEVLTPAFLVVLVAGVLLFIHSKISVTTYLNLYFKESGKHYKIPLWSKKIYTRFLALSCIFLLIFTFDSANKSFALQSYISDQVNSSSFIEDHYVDPAGKLTFPEEKRNLIYIFLESMEFTYASEENQGAFKENYIPELLEIAKENYSFSNTSGYGGYKDAFGTSWTMAAMFSHSTGLPLKLPIQGNTMSEYGVFLPGVISIGDILKEHGYSNNLLIGSDATFGGRRNFYMQHGDYDIVDYKRALEEGMIPDGYSVWWGYEDEKLFGFAKEKLLKLSENEEPFNLTMLTADTHHEDGYMGETTEDKFEEQYANVIANSYKQVDEFLDWIKQQDFYENTTVVIVGDHGTMDVDFLDDIDSYYERTMYNVFVNPVKTADTEILKNREFTAFDLFPSTLSSLGVEIEGNKLGLGVDLFSGERTLLEEYGIQMNTELSRKSLYYTSRFIGGIGAEPYQVPDN